ncbi:MAG: HAD-IB family phosphatase [bacterium]
MTAAGFASIVLDVDSTLCGIEGIDWLAALRGAAVGAEVSALTDRAMRGEIALESVYGQRLALVAPGRDEIAALSRAYVASVAPGAVAAVTRLRHAGRRVVLVSGGLREAILPVAALVGLGDADVHAVSVHVDARGAYAGFDTATPLATAGGKPIVVKALRLPSRALAVGDGVTDVAMRPAVDAFAAFTGFVRREPVVSSADFVLTTFDQLLELALG